jgi:hypothetical protein
MRETILFMPQDYGSIPKPYLYAGSKTKRKTKQLYRVSVSKGLVHWTTSIKFIKIMPLQTGTKPY